jgi:DNA-binding transcriptional regulator YhcF (GntR family)
MMRLWLSRNAAASLRDQLTVQIRLGVLSGELSAGVRLPSVRAMARQHALHANTVSAAYRDLERDGWLESRKGSGVYVAPSVQRAPSLDGLIADFLAAASTHGFSPQQVRDALNRTAKPSRSRRILIAEPEPELCQILVAELAENVSLPISALSSKDHRKPGTVVAALTGRAGVLPPTLDPFWLRLRSVPEHFAGQQRPHASALIAVASASPEILRRAHTLISAVGVDADALEFRDAREQGWSRGLAACAFVIADVLTARRMPKGCTVRVLRVLSEAAIEDLRAHVTPAKVS